MRQPLCRRPPAPHRRLAERSKEARRWRRTSNSNAATLWFLLGGQLSHATLPRSGDEGLAEIIKPMHPDIIAKIALSGKDLNAYSLETVKMFYDDARAAGYKLV